ncbi:MAG: hypothetical protein JKY93_12925 [Gammaproteobacteria bacterium]|nr:hypothetical protein [Gammaproteobacteria bacterium]
MQTLLLTPEHEAELSSGSLRAIGDNDVVYQLVAHKSRTPNPFSDISPDEAHVRARSLLHMFQTFLTMGDNNPDLSTQDKTGMYLLTEYIDKLLEYSQQVRRC